MIECVYMNTPDEKFIFHGSHESFDIAIPRRNRRLSKDPNSEGWITKFDEISFHATSYYWIALSYTRHAQMVMRDGKEYWFTMGVDLKKYKEEVAVYGLESLEKTLEVLYGKGGYILKFDKNDFFTQEGLGVLEMIVKKETKPLSIERVDDPVGELKKLGIPFVFKDLLLPENNWVL